MAKKTEFTDYISSLTEAVSIHAEERDELREELEQHLNELMHHYMEQGQTKLEAVKSAMKQFGDPEQLQPEFQKSHIPYWKRFVSKEISVWLICLLAASIGPILLINARYTPIFVAFPVMFLIVCALLYHGVIQRVRQVIVWFVMFVLFYGTFTWEMVQFHSFEQFMQELVTFRLGGEGFATIFFIHLFWAAALLGYVIKGWRALLRTSYEYWAMISIAIFMIKGEWITNSGERKVLLLNTVLLYVFLQQIIESKMLINIKNKLKHWMVQG